MNPVDVAALTASAISGTLAVVAIVLSIVFYRMSSRLADRMQQAGEKVSEGVGRLEKLFDTLYRDALAQLKETYSDLRSRPAGGCPPGATGGESDRKLEAVKREILAGLSGLVARSNGGLTGQRDVETMSAEAAEIIDRAIAQSRAGE